MIVRNKLGGAGRALQNKNFRYYWMGATISILGFWLSKLALGLLTWQLTQSPLWLGIIGFSATFPTALFAPFAGVVADRFGLRKTAFFAFAASSLNALLLGILSYSGEITIELLSVLVIIQGITLAFDLPSRQALVYYTVPRNDLSSAIALNTTTFHLGAFIGPGIFAVIHSFMDLSFCFFFNSFSFLAFAVGIRAMTIKPGKIHENTGSTILTDMMDGIRYTLSHPGIYALLSLAASSHILLRPYIDLLPAFSDLIFNRGETGFAMLAAASGMGSLLGGIWLSFRGKNEGLTRLLCFGILGAAVAMLVFAITNIYVLGLLCMFIVGFSLIIMNVASQSLVQNVVDPSKRARVISLSTGVAVGFPAVGALVLGYFGNMIGIQLPVIFASGLCLIYFLRASKRLRLQEKDLESPPESIKII
jgi:MFS family permease